MNSIEPHGLSILCATASVRAYRGRERPQIMIEEPESPATKLLANRNYGAASGNGKGDSDCSCSGRLSGFLAL